MTAQAILQDDPTGLGRLSTALEEQQAATEQEGTWQCTCGQVFKTSDGLGGHIGRKKNKADHKTMGFVPTPKAAPAPVQPPVVPVQGNPVPAQNTSAPVKEEKQETKAQGKGKKLAVSGKTTGNFDQAAFLVVTPKEFRTQSSSCGRPRR